MPTDDPQPGFRTARELTRPTLVVDVQRGAERLRVCEECNAWTGHVERDGSFECLSCQQVPDADQADDQDVRDSVRRFEEGR